MTEDRRCDSCGMFYLSLSEIDRGVFWCRDCVEEEE